MQKNFVYLIPGSNNPKSQFYSLIIDGVEEALKDKNVDYRIFGKPFLKSYRRMGVILAPNLEKAKKAAKKIFVKAI